MSLIITSDLDDKGDEVHFNSEALRMMGKRYAVEMAKLHGFDDGKDFKKMEREAEVKSEK